MSGQLGRRIPRDWEHYDKYPLTASLLSEITRPRPVVIGINWYTNFDHPQKDSGGNYWIGRGNLGTIRGGHCVCLKERKAPRGPNEYAFYDQGTEGACVGFGTSTMMSHFNHKLYWARWLWDRAKEVDEWPETGPGDNEGTSVRAALDIVRTKGHIVYDPTLHDALNHDGVSGEAYLRSGFTATYAEGIAANRWIRSMDDCLEVLGYQGLDYVDVMNSWGTFYPSLVRLPVTTLERLWKEDGEIGVPTDR